jgi:F0F1-type ATP synthase membrane subunit b/b'
MKKILAIILLLLLVTTVMGDFRKNMKKRMKKIENETEKAKHMMK